MPNGNYYHPTGSISAAEIHEIIREFYQWFEDGLIKYDEYDNLKIHYLAECAEVPFTRSQEDEKILDDMLESCNSKFSEILGEEVLKSDILITSICKKCSN